MQHPRMPNGILLLAALCFLMAGSFLLIGSLFAISPTTLGSWGFRPNPATQVRLWGLGFFGAVGALAGAVGAGLLRLKRWARHFVISGALCTLGRIVISFLMRGADGAAAHSLLNVAAVLVPAAALWYLWIPSVRATFGGAPSEEEQGEGCVDT